MMTRPSGNQHRAVWTPEQDGEIRRLAADGWSVTAAAKHFGTTRGAVIGRAHRLKPKVRFNSDLGLRPQNAVPRKRVRKVVRAAPILVPANGPLPASSFSAPTTPAKSLAELGPGECHFIVEDGGYCGQATHRTYCPYHHAIVWKPIPGRVRLNRRV